MAREKLTPIERLMQAADRYSVARSEANWTNGYRTACLSKGDETTEARMYDKEREQWDAVERAEAKMRRAFLAVLRRAANAGGEP